HGDVVVKVDDQPVKTNRDLIDYISSKAPGSKVALTYIRDGKEKTSVATLDTREDEGEKTQAEEDVHQTKEKIGVSVTDLTPSARRTYRIDKETAGGVVVTHVKPVSTAADAGLEEGDVILEVNGTEVNSVDDFQAQMKKSSKAKYVRFYVSRTRTKQTFIAAVKLEE
ncbi:MAG TPA: PDZ domain-containing protein, partial [Thermoanaerobaculia bacterium]|nr:PDZ domain-containing protein [Thermoanaerobaculia bacterium]